MTLDAANTVAGYPNTIVLTLSPKSLNVATHVRIEPARTNGLKEISWAKCEQILTISKDRLTALWGTVSSEDLSRIESATKNALALP
jgi:mRNA-degrading endonuclease toxin of MazEF toxin-antitoxin module